MNEKYDDMTKPKGKLLGIGWPIWLLFALLGVVAVRFLLVPDDGFLFAQDTATSAPRPISPPTGLNVEELANIEIFRNRAPSVVYIKSSVVQSNPFSRNVMERPQGSGSGFVWDKAGHIVTNYHVVAKADRAQVILPDQSTWMAKAVGFAAGKDIAILKIDAPESALHPIPIGTSNDLQVGQMAYAIGSPFGLDQTLTIGVISGLDREITSPSKRRISDVIQTDAAINPGNSGGPLLDSGGRLIGVNTAIVSPSGAFAGIGFAIPVDTVNRIVPQLIEHGQIVHPWLGIAMTPPRELLRIGIKPIGVHVRQVVDDGPADVAGIRATKLISESEFQLGDFIIQMDDVEIETQDDLFDFLETARVGQPVTVKVMRPESLDKDSNELTLRETELQVILAKDLELE